MMMEFKRQTNRSTRMDRTDNINIFLNNFEFGVVTSKRWGDFSEYDSKNPLIQFRLEGKDYEMRLDEFVKKLAKVVKRK